MFSALLSAIGANIIYFILHIQNTSSFPKPLPPKEEAEMLKRMKDGDKAARAVLIERNLRLVSHIVKKYYSKTNDTDDLISIGTIGLIKAIDSFNVEKGTRLATYASRCIENEILMHFRAGKKSSGDVYLGDTLEIDKDGNPLTIEDTISNPDDLADDLETKIRWEKVSKIIENLEDEREKEIIILRYGLNNKK
ncbi:MAG: sigma-70 family RNA polymerase sigma factor, partial [Clostridiales bacterium]|nr:sigma-70 family RNA polymerase sigma factor [Clostridiales bacterium]